MSRTKTSQAVIKTIRLNPINEEERRSLQFIEDNEARGYDFKKTVVDAINYRAGATPEMFSSGNGEMAKFARLVEYLFDNFTSELMSKINSGEIKVSNTLEEDAAKDNGVSAFTRNFTRSFLQRQQQALGEENEN